MRKIGLVAAVVLTIIVMTGCQSVSLMERSRTIAVQGTGRVAVAPDIASFSVTVSELAETTREAQVKANGKVGELLTMAREAGVAEKDIQTAALEFYPEYRWKDDEQILVGQRVRQTVHLTIRGIGEGSTILPSLIDRIGTVSGISIGSIGFSKEDTTSEYAESRALAMEKAIQKASGYAVAAGMTLGKPISVSDYSTVDAQSGSRTVMAKAAGAYMMESVAQVPTGELDITSTVSVVFELR
jgi:uncharacterized protein YggE